MKLATIAILLPSACILLFWCTLCPPAQGLTAKANAGPHGLSEILYAFALATGNNGSAFAGLAANTPYYNALLGVALWVGRFGVIIPALAIAGGVSATKKVTPPSPGTFPPMARFLRGCCSGRGTDCRCANFFPALSLGPIIEHLLMNAGRTILRWCR